MQSSDGGLSPLDGDGDPDRPGRPTPRQCAFNLGQAYFRLVRVDRREQVEERLELHGDLHAFAIPHDEWSDANCDCFGSRVLQPDALLEIACC
jgi:hypothetical protein